MRHSRLLLLFTLSALSQQQYAQGSTPKLADPKASTSSLKFLHVVWRHGDRTPSRALPSDTANPITSWDPPIASQLTHLGAEQHFRLGQFIRLRYDGFLPAEYSFDQVKVRRTDYNRTLWSARCDMAGMFYGGKYKSFGEFSRKWNESGALLEAFKMDMVPKEEDLLLSDAYEACPRVPVEEKAQYNTSEFMAVEKNNSHFLHFLGEKAGLGADKIPLPLKDMYRVMDHLTYVSNHPERHHLPEWVTPKVLEEVRRLYNEKNWFEYNTQTATRLQVGKLFGEILDRMQAVSAVNETNRTKKQQLMQIYSAHDVTVEGVLVAMGQHTRIYPRYATAVLIELHKDSDKGDYVRLFHRNDTYATDLWELEIAGCPAPCRLATLDGLTRNKLVPASKKELNSECKAGVNGVGRIFSGQQWIVTGVALVFLMALVL